MGLYYGLFYIRNDSGFRSRGKDDSVPGNARVQKCFFFYALRGCIFILLLCSSCFRKIIHSKTISSHKSCSFHVRFYQSRYKTRHSDHRIPSGMVGKSGKRCHRTFFHRSYIHRIHGKNPLATVLIENGLLFAGVVGFIYPDLMVPPWFTSMPNIMDGRLLFILPGS